MNSLLIKKATNPQFGITQCMSTCPRCMRNIDPVIDEQAIGDYIAVEDKYVISGISCPHCGLGAKPKIHTVC